MILFVCVGNVCRSPLAAALVAGALAAADVEMQVLSAGTHAAVDRPVDDTTLLIARQFGLATIDHHARQLDPDTARGAGLILAATRQIRRDVVRLHPPAVQYSFTIRQFQRIMSTSREPFATTAGAPPVQTLLDLRSFAGSARGWTPPPGRDVDDLPDPHGRPKAVHEQVTGLMVPGLNALLGAFGATPLVWPRWN